MDEKTKELIDLYESIIHGNEDGIGLFNCYDTYYNGCWDDRLDKVKILKEELEKYNN